MNKQQIERLGKYLAASRLLLKDVEYQEEVTIKRIAEWAEQNPSAVQYTRTMKDFLCKFTRRRLND